jgi:protein gp37
MGELFGNWIPSEWIESIIAITWVAPYHTYQVLTKFPHNLNNWQFPQWWWVGTTIDNNQWERGHELLCNCDAVIKFISFEPLLAKPTGRLLSYVIPVMDWIIIGAQTNPYKPPKQEWITAILEAANVSGKPVPVFMKNNLKPIWPGVLQQQWPNDNLADFQGHRQTVTA